MGRAEDFIAQSKEQQARVSERIDAALRRRKEQTRQRVAGIENEIKSRQAAEQEEQQARAAGAGTREVARANIPQVPIAQMGDVAQGGFDTGGGVQLVAGGPQPAAGTGRQGQAGVSGPSGTLQSQTTRQVHLAPHQIGPFRISRGTRDLTTTTTQPDINLFNQKAATAARELELGADQAGVEQRLANEFPDPNIQQAIASRIGPARAALQIEKKQTVGATAQTLMRTFVSGNGAARRPIDQSTAQQVADLLWRGAFREAAQVLRQFTNTDAELAELQRRTETALVRLNEFKVNQELAAAESLANKEEAKAEILSQNDMSTIAFGPARARGIRNLVATEAVGLPTPGSGGDGGTISAVNDAVQKRSSQAFGLNTIEA
jgi:hypothetical protein